jgi:septum formation topological specificity factor MinE
MAVAELLNISEHELLQKLMDGYVKTVRKEIVDVAQKYPAFEDRYPFVQDYTYQ